MPTSTLLLRATALVLCLLAAACGGGGDDGVQPLPLEEGKPTAYSEAYLVQHPESAVRPEHIVIVRLESVQDPNDLWDTGVGNGIDRIRYFVDRPTPVWLEADAQTELLDSIVLRDANGREIGRHVRGGGGAVTLTLTPGVYSLELRHARAGDPTAPAQTLFLRLAAAGQSVARTPTLPGAADPTTIATASRDCLNCNISDFTVDAGSNFDGADMSGSTFTRVTMDNVSARNGTCLKCTFDPISLVASDFTGSDLSGSTFNGNLSGLSMTADSTCRNCSFLGQLENIHFWSAQLSDSLLWLRQSVYVIDLSGADCTRCKIYGFLSSGNSRVEILHFERMRLTSAHMEFFTVTSGRFDGAVIDQASMFIHCDDCQMSGVSARGLMFSSSLFGHADWSRADLTSAQLLGDATLLQSGSLAGAKLDGMTPANYFGSQPFKNQTRGQQIDYRGASLAHLDLSQAAWSTAQALVDASTDFRDATLSNGATGIDLSGQNLAQVKTLVGLDLRGGLLVNTNLFQAPLACVKLDHANLVGANLSDTDLSRASFVGAQFGVTPGTSTKAATLVNALLLGADFTDADLRSVDLSNARAYNGTTKLACSNSSATFLRARLDSASLADAWLGGVSFTGASLNQTNLVGAKLVDVTFGSATLVGTKFDDGTLWGVDFRGAASTEGVSLANTSVSTASSAMTYIEQDGSATTFAYEPTALGALGQTETRAICPSGQNSPCSTPASLVPPTNPMYPPKPNCTYDRRGNKICS